MEGKMNALLKTAAEPDAMEYVEDFDIPQIKDDEVLMEIKAVGICGTDHSLYRWNPAIANSYHIHCRIQVICPAVTVLILWRNR